MEKILSICIPVYNGGEMAYQHIKEILTYENDDIEVVVSDNASTDNTLELLNEIEDERLRIITHKENRGPFINWYRVLMAGVGKYVMLHQDNDRIVVKNLSRYVEFLRNVQYDVIRNCPGLSESREITVAQVQYYHAVYSHASYVMYRREALHSIKPWKCSMDQRHIPYPYLLWDTQILMKYALQEKRAYLNGEIKITYSPKEYRNKESRGREFDKSNTISYSHETIKNNFTYHMRILRHLYSKDCEYSKLLCNAYRENLYEATIRFYEIMNDPKSRWMKNRYGLTALDNEEIDYVKLNDDFFRRIRSELQMRSPWYRFLTMIELKLITIYNKGHFLINVYGGKRDVSRIRRCLHPLLKFYVEKVWG